MKTRVGEVVDRLYCVHIGCTSWIVRDDWCVKHHPWNNRPVRRRLRRSTQ